MAGTSQAAQAMAQWRWQDVELGHHAQKRETEGEVAAMQWVGGWWLKSNSSAPTVRTPD